VADPAPLDAEGDRDQIMGQRNANDACVAYAPDTPMAGRTLTAKAAMLEALGTAVCVRRNPASGGR
jgi:hypothetical protein